jgi:hypothetical protein
MTDRFSNAVLVTGCSTDEGPMALFAGNPDDVAKMIARAAASTPCSAPSSRRPMPERSPR